jgi:photosystem II stability/assembly factor-like uncharacterized protein
MSLNVQPQHLRALRLFLMAALSTTTVWLQGLNPMPTQAQQSTPPPTPWQLQNPQNRSNTRLLFQQVGWRGVAFLRQTVGCVVGQQGEIFTTTDDGVTWTVQQSPTQRDLYQVQFVNATTGWTVGDDGVFGTTDGGRTWTQQTADIDGSALFFLNAERGWAVGSSGRILATTNGGRTWTRQTSGLVNNIRAVQFVDERTGFALGNFDGLIGTTDGGATWRQVLDRESAELRSSRGTGFTFVSPTLGFITCEDGSLLSTQDGGRTWSRQRLRPENVSGNDLQKIVFVNATTGWVLAENNSVFGTTDGGRVWTLLGTIPVNAFVSDITFTTANTGWAVGSNSTPNQGIYQSVLWRTQDGGRTWEQVRTTRLNDFFSLAAPNAQTAYAVGQLAIAATSNGGALWTAQAPERDTTSNLFQSYRTVHFLNATTGWMAGQIGRTAATSDGGRTWRPLPISFGDDSLLGIHFVSALQGCAVGCLHGYGRAVPQNGGRISITSDGGRTWRRATIPAGTDIVNDVHFVSSSLGWAVGRGGTVLVTSDGGQSWTRKQSNTTAELRGVFFVNDNLGWAVGGSAESAIIIATQDGGETWTRQSPPADAQLQNVHFVDAANGWAVGNGGIMLATQDGGTTWRQQTIGTRADLNDVRFVSAVRGWVVGDSGRIFRTTNGGYTPRVDVAVQNPTTNSPITIPTNLLRFNFGIIPVGQTTSQTVTLTGQYLLSPLTVSVPEGFLLDYGSLTNQRSVTLAPNEATASTNAEILVRFAPTTSGTITGRLELRSALVSTSLTMAGFGLNRANVRVSPTPMLFGQIAVGADTTILLKLTNVGTAQGVVVAMLNSREYTLERTPQMPPQNVPNLVQGALLRPNDSLEVPVRFAPRTFGERTDTLIVRVRDNTDSTIRIPLVGTGLQAFVRAEPDTLDLGVSSLGQPRTGMFRIRNVGNRAAVLQSSSLVVSDAFSLSAGMTAATLAPNASLLVGITFTPQRLGFTTATLALQTDGATNNSTTGVLRVVLEGRGIPLLDAPVLVLPPNERINQSLSPVFQWQASERALLYDWQLARDSSFRIVEFERTNLRLLGLALDTSLTAGQRYYWRARAKNPTATSPWSAAFVFETSRGSANLTVSPEPVPFGTVVVNQPQRLFFNISARNRTTLTSTRWRRNDGSAFSVDGSQFPQVLERNRTATVIVNFRPPESRGFQGILQVFTTTDTAEVQMFGTGIDSTASTIVTELALRIRKKQPDGTATLQQGDTVRPGDTLKLQIVLARSANLRVGRQDRAVSFDAKLRLRNPSTLAVLSDRPTQPANLTTDNLTVKTQTIEFSNIPRAVDMRQGVLAEVEARALLGDATNSTIEFLSFTWNDVPSGLAVIQNVLDSSFTMSVCRTGGSERLLGSTNSTQLHVVANNPVSDAARIHYALNETGHTELFLMDVLGRRVKTFLSARQAFGDYEATLPMNDVPNGLYTLVLQTPTELHTQRLGVIK